MSEDVLYSEQRQTTNTREINFSSFQTAFSQIKWLSEAMSKM